LNGPETLNQRGRWGLEVAVVLCFGVLPPLASALLAYPQPSSALPDPLRQWTLLIVRSIQVLAPALYIISRSDDGWKAFGWRRWSFHDDLVVGLALGFAGRYISVEVANFAARWMGGYSPQVQSQFREAFHVTGWGFSLMLLALVANSFAEEVVMRSFLIRRFGQLFGKPLPAVLLSALLFGSYHVYQGGAPACGVMSIGLLFGAVFAYQGRLAPLVIAHTLINVSHSF
jgi:membrane protease YdiL (CAAX protease family)